MADGIKVHPLDILQVDVDGSFDTDPSPSGVTSYEELENKPRIEGRELVGDRSFADLGLPELSNFDLQQMYNSIVRS